MWCWERTSLKNYFIPIGSRLALPILLKIGVGFRFDMAILEERVETPRVDRVDTAFGVADRQMRVIVQLRVVAVLAVNDGNGRGRRDKGIGLGAVKVAKCAISVQNLAQCLPGTAVVVLE